VAIATLNVLVIDGKTLVFNEMRNKIATERPALPRGQQLILGRLQEKIQVFGETLNKLVAFGKAGSARKNDLDALVILMLTKQGDELDSEPILLDEGQVQLQSQEKSLECLLG